MIDLLLWLYFSAGASVAIYLVLLNYLMGRTIPSRVVIVLAVLWPLLPILQKWIYRR